MSSLYSDISDFSVLPARPRRIRGGGKKLKGGNSGNDAVIAIVVVVIVLLFIAIVLAAVWGTRQPYKSSELVVVNDQTGYSRVAGKRVHGAVELSSEQEAKELLAGDEPAMVFIYADWCGFCNKAKPIYEELAADPANSHVKLAKINADAAKALCKEKGINGFPTFLSNFGDKKYVGYKPKDGMQRVLSAAMDTKKSPGRVVSPTRFVPTQQHQHQHQQQHQHRHRHQAAHVRAAHARPAHAQKAGGVIELNEQEAQAALNNATEPAMVFLYADWCGFCKKMKPVYEELAADPKYSHVKMIKVNGETAKGMTAKYDVNGFPSFITNFSKEKKHVGYKPKEAFMAILAEA